MRQQAHVVIAVSSDHAREEDIVSHRSTNDVVLPAGIDGAIPPRFNRYVMEYPSLRSLWDRKTREWERNTERFSQPVINGNPFYDEDDDSIYTMDRSRPSGDTSAYGKGRNGHGESPYDKERGPWSEDSKAVKPPVGTGHRANYMQKTILRGRAVQASDSEENTEGPRDCHPVGGIQMETPVGSGLFDTDDEGQAESEAKLEFGENNVRETMPYEPTPDLDGRGEKGYRQEGGPR